MVYLFSLCLAMRACTAQPPCAARFARVTRRRASVPARAATSGAPASGLPAHSAELPADDLVLDNCQPIGKRVLFVADEVEEKTAGGILLPSSSAQRSGGFVTGEVVKVGDAVDVVKAGTKALVSGSVLLRGPPALPALTPRSYGGTEVDFQGRKAKFVLDSDIIGILS